MQSYIGESPFSTTEDWNKNHSNFTSWPSSLVLAAAAATTTTSPKQNYEGQNVVVPVSCFSDFSDFLFFFFDFLKDFCKQVIFCIESFIFFSYFLQPLYLNGTPPQFKYIYRHVYIYQHLLKLIFILCTLRTANEESKCGQILIYFQPNFFFYILFTIERYTHFFFISTVFPLLNVRLGFTESPKRIIE